MNCHKVGSNSTQNGGSLYSQLLACSSTVFDSTAPNSPKCGYKRACNSDSAIGSDKPSELRSVNYHRRCGESDRRRCEDSYVRTSFDVASTMASAQLLINTWATRGEVQIVIFFDWEASLLEAGSGVCSKYHCGPPRQQAMYVNTSNT